MKNGSEKRLRILVLLTLALLLLPSIVLETSTQEEIIPREQAIMGQGAGMTRSFNPVQFWSRMEYVMVDPMVYEVLGVWDQLTGEYRPWLAESWEWTDSETFMIYLREEPYFRDGSPLTAEDVVFSLTTLGNETFGGPLVADFQEYIESIEALDERTVRIKVTAFNIRAFGLLEYPIFSKARWSRLIEEMGVGGILEYLNNDPDEMEASGPYTLHSDSAEKTVFIRNDNWWANQIGWSAAPKYIVLDRLIETAEAITRVFKAGEIDGSGFIFEGEFEFLKANKDRFGCWDVDAATPQELHASGAQLGVLLALNMEVPVFRQRWFREALAYAVDYERAAEAAIIRIWGSALPIHPWHALYDQYANNTLLTENFETEMHGGRLHIKYDMDKALEILEAHCEGSVAEGWTWNGSKIGPFELPIVAGWTPEENLMTVVADSITAIGIPVEIVTYSYGAWGTKVEARDFEMIYTERTNLGPLEPIQSLYELFIGVPGAWSSSPADYQNTFDGSYPELENTAEEVKNLILEAFRYPVGSPESIALVNEIESIVVPQLSYIPLNLHYTFAIKCYRGQWVNQPTKDDPYPHRENAAAMREYLEYKSAHIDTIGVSVNPALVEVGKPVTVSVTLRNNGESEQLHQVDVRKGPAAAWPDWPELLAWNIATIPAGSTKTVTMTVTFTEPGSYILTVDNWRIGKYDPGDPVEKTLIVTPPVTGLTIEDAVRAAEEAKDLAQDAAEAANAAKAAADAAKTAADAAAEAAKAAMETAAPMWMVWAASIVTIVVVLGGVYVITKGKR